MKRIIMLLCLLFAMSVAAPPAMAHGHNHNKHNKHKERCERPPEPPVEPPTEPPVEPPVEPPTEPPVKAGPSGNGYVPNTDGVVDENQDGFIFTLITILVL